MGAAHTYENTIVNKLEVLAQQYENEKFEVRTMEGLIERLESLDKREEVVIKFLKVFWKFIQFINLAELKSFFGTDGISKEAFDLLIANLLTISARKPKLVMKVLKIITAANNFEAIMKEKGNEGFTSINERFEDHSF